MYGWISAQQIGNGLHDECGARSVPDPRSDEREKDMHLMWNIEERDVETVKDFFPRWSNDPFVNLRQQRNINLPRPVISRESIWMVMVGCLVTTQQRSGPGSAVKRFLNTQPFVLNYNECVNKSNLEQFAENTITSFGGIRRAASISRQIVNNLAILENDYWDNLIHALELMNNSDDPIVERKCAHIIAGTFEGIGPKQSRNFLQWLGVSRYEIPIDSRITKWLNRHVLKHLLSSTLLSDSVYYDMISDGVLSLCERAGIYPCLLDAAIFTSFDGGWSESDIGSCDTLEGA